MKNFIKNFNQFQRLNEEEKDLNFQQTALDFYGKKHSQWIEAINRQLDNSKCVYMEEDPLFMKKVIADLPKTVLPNDLNVVDKADIDEIFRKLSDSEVPMFYLNADDSSEVNMTKLTGLLDSICSYCSEGSPAILFEKEKRRVGIIMSAFRPLKRKYGNNFFARYGGHGRTTTHNSEEYHSPKRGYRK